MVVKLHALKGGACRAHTGQILPRNGTQIVMDRIRTEPVVYT